MSKGRKQRDHPAIYDEVNDGYVFKTFNHQVAFNERPVPRHFDYEKYKKEQELKEHNTTKVDIVLINE